MRLKSIIPIPPKPSRCIEVDSPDRLFVTGKPGEEVISHNSVAQRNILLGCILRPDKWRVLCVDLKKVELSAYRAYSNVVLGVATTLEDALVVLRFAQETMMKRYSELEQLGLNNFLDMEKELGGDSQAALLLMVDEAGELLGSSGVKALSEETLIPTPEGLKKLKELVIGDIIFDNYSKHTVITDKYEPTEQKRYKMTISRVKDGVKESIIAGSEHNWVAFFEHPDGSVDGPKIVTTEYLESFKRTQDSFDPIERVKVKFKKFE